ncbi:hypothetical protein BT96DRAFT_927462 [Gymnopus androsaceus JB14]|uniref:Uncharacterized protein n=1 Tax=Gymnopus androsaceus JB14 TaxID=1447944 RepID=A0A6A4GPK3_9AGAR|nr:hypothetical protein BT96DRAFT_927462 [Gymnopus androsaceus JB14]
MTSSAAECIEIKLPQGSATVSVPITVTWSLASTDPTAFGLMEKNINLNIIASVAPVDAGSEFSGATALTFDNEGQFVIQGITQPSSVTNISK